MLDGDRKGLIVALDVLHTRVVAAAGRRGLAALSRSRMTHLLVALVETNEGIGRRHQLLRAKSQRPESIRFFVGVRSWRWAGRRRK